MVQKSSEWACMEIGFGVAVSGNVQYPMCPHYFKLEDTVQRSGEFVLIWSKSLAPRSELEVFKPQGRFGLCLAAHS